MKQTLEAMFGDGRGVSPVIGVILMVAITVILAAVVGTFVLGLGDQLEQAPQSTLNAESSNATSVNVSHDGGDGMAVDDLLINIEGNSTEFSTANNVDAGTEFSVGDTATFVDDGNITADSDVRVRVIHEPSDSIVMDQTVDVPEE